MAGCGGSRWTLSSSSLRSFSSLALKQLPQPWLLRKHCPSGFRIYDFLPPVSGGQLFSPLSQKAHELPMIWCAGVPSCPPCVQDGACLCHHVVSQGCCEGLISAFWFGIRGHALSFLPHCSRAHWLMWSRRSTTSVFLLHWTRCLHIQIILSVALWGRCYHTCCVGWGTWGSERWNEGGLIRKWQNGWLCKILQQDGAFFNISLNLKCVLFLYR